jgi:transposase
MGFFVARRAKRLWSDEEKRSICLQTAASEVSVAQVARRYVRVSVIRGQQIR